MKKEYRKPGVTTETSFETASLTCGKTPDHPPGSWHFTGAYDTFTGHYGPAMGGSESMSGSLGVGLTGPASTSYAYSGLCTNWVTFSS